MVCRSRFSSFRAVFPALFLAVLASGFLAEAQEPNPPQSPGQFFTVTEPITQEQIDEIRASTQPILDRLGKQGLGEKARPTFLFEFRPGETKPGLTSYGNAHDLTELISRELRGANMTVAYVPEPIRGNAVLGILACDEIVMGPNAAIGPIVREGQRVPEHVRQFVRDLARLKGREPDLYLGLLEPAAELRMVRTDDRAVHFVLAENLPEFRKSHVVVGDDPAWESSRPGVLSAETARERGIIKMIVDDRGQIASAYHLPNKAIVDDPTADGAVKAAWITIDGKIDSTKESYLRRRVLQASQDGLNLIVFQINSEGGEEKATDNIADVIANAKGLKTVAYINDRALGMACLIPLACNEIVFHSDSQMGDLQHAFTSGGNLRSLDAHQLKTLSEKAAFLAKKNNHPAAIARAMADPDAVILQAKDNQTGAVVYILESDRLENPGRYAVVAPVQKRAGEPLLVTDQEAMGYGMGQAVVKGDDELKLIYGVKDKNLRIDKPTWVDSLITTLSTTWMRTILLFIGMFMLILELKLPGIGLPAVISALSFLLFFWSSYMNKTADELEILLFLLGLVCLALELFVFPGFGVFGMSGVLLILVSVVMASHTFVWPTQESEYREMGFTLLQMLAVMLAVGTGAVLVGRFLPSIPFFNRMVLMPEPIDEQLADDPGTKPSQSGDANYHFLVGETGRTTTVLRPAGKARFGELLLDVTADGFFIEPNTLVEVTEVQGSKIIVKRV